MAKHLVTGGAGFIGSHLADYLIQRGDSVSIIDNLSTGRMSNVAHLEGNKGFHCIIDDIRNEQIVGELIREADYVHHLAASVGVRLVIERPTESIVNNIAATEIVLENACRFRKPVLIASTSEVYGKCERSKFQEDDDCIMGATSKTRWGYATSKAIDEFLALAYFYEKQLPVVIVRLFNTVGPRQSGHYGMVIPNLVRQALLNEPVTVYGNGQQTRCFAHVHDVVPTLVGLITRSTAYGTVFNIGSQEEISISALAERIIEMTGSNSTIRYVSYEQAYPPGFEDMGRRMPDLARVQRMVGYQPRLKLDDILHDVIADLRPRLGQKSAFPAAEPQDMSSQERVPRNLTTT
jgi:nucleoside-diphosphate-sugar epimerase